jgi:hypothetical protein
MDTKVYVTRKKVTLADGTVREYTSQYKYQKKRQVVHKPALQLIKEINDPVKLQQVIDFIRAINGGETRNNQV